jgi:hypothetical protein
MSEGLRLESPAEPGGRHRSQRSVSRFWILAGAFTATAATLALALLAGSWAFDYRRYSQHEGRLERVLQQQPTIDQVTAGLEEEGASVLSTPETADELEAVIVAHGGQRVDGLREKARRWGHLRVFLAADMLYFVFYDDEGVMRDFACVGA